MDRQAVVHRFGLIFPWTQRDAHMDKNAIAQLLRQSHKELNEWCAPAYNTGSVPQQSPPIPVHMERAYNNLKVVEPGEAQTLGRYWGAYNEDVLKFMDDSKKKRDTTESKKSAMHSAGFLCSALADVIKSMEPNTASLPNWRVPRLALKLVNFAEFLEKQTDQGAEAGEIAQGFGDRKAVKHQPSNFLRKYKGKWGWWIAAWIDETIDGYYRLRTPAEAAPLLSARKVAFPSRRQIAPVKAR